MDLTSQENPESRVLLVYFPIIEKRIIEPFLFGQILRKKFPNANLLAGAGELVMTDFFSSNSVKLDFCKQLLASRLRSSRFFRLHFVFPFPLFFFLSSQLEFHCQINKIIDSTISDFMVVPSPSYR